MKSLAPTSLLAAVAVLVGTTVTTRPQSAPPAAASRSQEAGARAYQVATFDSGFGGYFTAKEIERQATALSAEGYGPFRIAHYGDTTNIPYGEKTPAEIAEFASAGIRTAFRDGARDVYIACNTASTQVDRIRAILRAENAAYPNRIHSIIDVSVRQVMTTVGAKLRTQDTVVVAILATPATVKSEAYPRFLAKALGVPAAPGQLTRVTQPRWLSGKGPSIDSVAYVTELALGDRKRVVVYQLAPANWVEMIENAAPDGERQEAVRRDLETLVGQANPRARFDVVGEFCTHYPVFDSLIREELRRRGVVTADTPFVLQGPLMGRLFRTRFLQGRPARRTGPVPPPGTPPIYLSGTNIDATRALARTIFPEDPEPVIERKAFTGRK